MMQRLAGFRIAALCFCFLAIAACSKKNTPDLEAGTNQAKPGSEQDFAVNVGDRVYFDLDRYDIRPEAYPRMDAQVAWLQRYPQVTIRIEGNADERGTREYNLALGARRAESVRAYLVERGVSAGRIDTISYGKERPIAAGSNECSLASVAFMES